MPAGLPDGCYQSSSQSAGVWFNNADDTTMDGTVATMQVGGGFDCLTAPMGGVCDDTDDADGDGFAGYPTDPGCSSGDDPDEHEPGLECDDGLDNDSDGLFDYRVVGGDPGCTSPTDSSELSGPPPPPPCANHTVDFDCDGLLNVADECPFEKPTPPTADGCEPPAYKAFAQGCAWGTGAAGGALGINALILALAGVSLAVPSAVLGVGLWGIGLICTVVASDPPDADYRKIPSARLKRGSRLRATGLTRSERKVAKRALATAALIDAHTRALLHAQERAQGAAAVGDRDWWLRQRAALRTHALAAASAILRQRRNLARLAAVLVRADKDWAKRIPRRALNRVRARLRASGLPSSLERQARDLGISAEVVSQIDATATRMRIRAPRRWIHLVYSPAIRRNLTAMSRMLRQHAEAQGAAAP